MRQEDNSPPQTITAELDHGELVSLMRDLAALVKVHQVLAKGPATAPMMDAMPVEFPEALALLESKQVRGIQIRYQHQQAEWIDTLTPLTENAYTLVRIKFNISE